MSLDAHLHLFAGYGIELEYMIVDRQSLAVRPLTDEILKEVNGGVIVNEVERGDMAWSNELVMHVLELKTNGPAPTLAGLDQRFHSEVKQLNELLAKHDAMLMPTAMHPSMVPARDTKLWPHDNAAVYDAYNRIFDCRGHGWSNLQSVHINFPFFDDPEFARLHAAIRLVLPLLPALAASSPIYEGKVSGFQDSRLEFYRHNQRAVPEITGGVIPEAAYSKADYQRQVFDKIFAAIKPHDPAGILQEEWLNSRGAIARFDRNAIEIRLLDIQESPRQDMAMAAAVVSLVKAQVDELWIGLEQQKPWAQAPLRELFAATVRDGGAAVIRDPAYLAAFGIKGAALSVADFWVAVTEGLHGKEYPLDFNWTDVDKLVRHGNLATRIVAATGPKPSDGALREVYTKLAQCLASNGRFDA